MRKGYDTYTVLDLLRRATQERDELNGYIAVVLRQMAAESPTVGRAEAEA